MTPKHRQSRLLIAAVLIALALAGGGCTEQKRPPMTATLTISDSGTYALDGKPLQQEQLKPELVSLRDRPVSLQLNIWADQKASYQAVGIAVKAAQDAGIGNIGFITEPPAQ